MFGQTARSSSSAADTSLTMTYLGIAPLRNEPLWNVVILLLVVWCSRPAPDHYSPSLDTSLSFSSPCGSAFSDLKVTTSQSRGQATSSYMAAVRDGMSD